MEKIFVTIEDPDIILTTKDKDHRRDRDHFQHRHH